MTARLPEKSSHSSAGGRVDQAVDERRKKRRRDLIGRLSGGADEIITRYAAMGSRSIGKVSSLN
jgi:hypothetical protein